MYFNLHTHQYQKSEDTIALVNQYPLLFDSTIPVYSIGIHPWHIKEENISQELAIIEQKLSEKGCLALGECGLDNRIEVPLDLQKEVLMKHFQLAEKYQKPVVIHCVGMFQELIQIKKQMNLSVPVIIHGFSKKQELAQQLLQNGFYLSFGKYLLRNPELGKVLQIVPLHRMFLETDTMEETIHQVYQVAAEKLSINEIELQNILQNNFKTVFNYG